jgi:flagellar hook protein FlgE
MSFYTSLSGLQAAQTDMSTISNNLANVNTDGFKKSTSQFADVMASSFTVAPSQQIGSGTVFAGNRQDFSEGNLQSTSSALDLAISGDGFFAVKSAGNSGAVDYTRNGSFLVDANGYVVDSQGSYLQAYPVDSSGNVTATGSDGLTNVQIPETSGQPAATSSVSLGVNLSPSATAPTTTTFDRTNASSYNNSSSTTIYDANGDPMTMTNYYVRDPAADTSGSTAWQVYSYVGDQQLTSGGSTAPTTISFDSSGALTSPSGAIAYDPVTPGASGVTQSLSLNLAGSTSTAAAFSVNSRSQDGAAIGQLSGVTVGTDGLITASFSNGDTQDLGKVAVANFSNPTGLRQDGNGYWSQTGISGAAKMGEAGDSGYGSLMSGTIEGSNVDVTEELVNLISAQQNYQANAKALSTQSQIVDTIVQMQS